MASLVWSADAASLCSSTLTNALFCSSVAFPWPEITGMPKLGVLGGKPLGSTCDKDRLPCMPSLEIFSGNICFLIQNYVVCVCEFLCSEHCLLTGRVVDKTFKFMMLNFSHTFVKLLLCELRRQCYIVASIGFLRVEDADSKRLCPRLEAGNTSFENLLQGSAISECALVCLEVGWNATNLTSTNAVNLQLFAYSLMRQLKSHFGSKKSSFGWAVTASNKLN